MLGFKSMDSARTILGGIEMVHMMRKGQAKYACAQQLSLVEQFERSPHERIGTALRSFCPQSEIATEPEDVDAFQSSHGLVLHSQHIKI
jgi:hypothetical protein